MCSVAYVSGHLLEDDMSNAGQSEERTGEEDGDAAISRL
jgi:hypothetical protein